ncbi:tail fiber assembly protein [Citrobacter sedlakii]|uniref:tail fiber assembly protein n=1 Tax=Citrobacter sedlakii TaxID=67826 RepID=UPI002B2292B1|nr:tail fiber assembly protein [Citrobacter sedlakii]MEB0952027.1 tail fiber assembly protein [Citrobacter sedlakii]
MKPVFENGMAVEAGNIRCFYYDSVTGEYTGWSDEYINIGVSMPADSTDIDPGDEVAGKVAVFKNSMWTQERDHRGEVVYSTTDGGTSTVDYIGDIKDGFTILAPSTPFDKWDGEKWVTDKEAQYAAEIEAAEAEKHARINQANDYMNSKQWPGKAAIGRLKGDELAQYNLWLDYLDALEAVDTSSAPNTKLPIPPGEQAS